MRRVAGTRQAHPDVLERTPGNVAPEHRWAALLIDPVAQIAELADLVERGLVSPADLERQRRKIFGA